jgi:hypothetical protein
VPSVLAVLVVGAAAGLFLAASYLPWPETAKPQFGWEIALIAAGVGAVTALALQVILRHLAVLNPRIYEHLTRLRVGGASGTKVSIAGVEVSFGEDELVALWPVYVQLSTRVTTNGVRLMHGEEVEHTGTTKAAFDSLRSLFDTTRTALTACPPAGVAVLAREMPTASEMVMSSINQCVRPFLARWHPWLDQWAATGLPERRWPGYENCREDLEQVRRLVLKIVQGLAEMYRLKAPPTEGLSIPWSGRSDTLDWGWGTTIDGAFAKAQHALAYRVPAGEATADRHWLLGVLTSWASLASTLEGHLAEMGAIPAAARLRPGEVRPDTQVRRWRTTLDTVLLPWQARTSAWDAVTDEELARCRQAVETVRSELRRELEALAPVSPPPK